ncbi:DNA excision repair protein ERCC-8-like [Sycon ciliatum]|uniref:DNA excision repair protein ERCC-8-like n=1 Tax=Sycon ciliatum TaxID=27933 RepID=UPI0031F70862|eukprot:scpid64609/ scgid18979/ DNA excision repair protein ERCC-8; Cockayne syndrome WD repeat protein CSA homolog
MPVLSGLLRDRSLGRISPWQLSSNVVTKRLLNLDINSDYEIQPFFTKSVKSLDIEKHDGKYMLAGGGDGSVALYDLEQSSMGSSGNMKVCNVINSTTAKSTSDAHKYSVEAVTWFPHDTGMFMTSSMDHTLKIWDTNAWLVAEQFQFEEPLYCHAVSSCTAHSLIAVARKEHSIKLCNLETGSTSQILRGHNDRVLSVAWSPSNDYHLVSGGADNKILMWDVRRAKSLLFACDQHNGRQQLTFDGKLGHMGAVTSVAFTPDGHHVVSLGNDKQLRVWDASTGTNTLVNFGRMQASSRRSIQMAISKDSRRRLIFVPNAMNVDCFDLSSGAKLRTLHGHFGNCDACVLRPGKQELFSGAMDSRILWWSARKAHSPVAVEEVRHRAEVAPRQVEVPQALQDAWSSDED